MIKKDIYGDLLSSLKIGASVAEQDEFLEEAKVETPVLDKLLSDELDLILGTKGAGKTSLFLLINALSPVLLDKIKVHIIVGVEAQGDPVFETFKKDFENFSETDFENFWKIYFINLIYNNFLISPKFESKVALCGDEMNKFISECSNAGIPQIKKINGFKEIVAQSINALKFLKKVKASGGVHPQTNTLFGTIEFELKENVQDANGKVPIYVSKIGEILENILDKTGFKIWLLLDRLDVIFEHGSDLEFLALRGLLKAYESFQIKAGKHSKSLRIKIFLRDDIFNFLTDVNEFKNVDEKKAATLSALSHIATRSTKSPLQWTKEQIQLLILKRLFISREMRAFFNVGIDELNTERIRIQTWNNVFGEKIEPGKNRPDSLSWICTRLSDARGIITPRSAIDFLSGVISEQLRLFNLNRIDQEKFFLPQAIKKGIMVASQQKYVMETKNEYKGLIQPIERLRAHSARLTKTELIEIYGKDFAKMITKFEKIGLISKKGSDFQIAFIFRSALEVHPQV